MKKYVIGYLSLHEGSMSLLTITSNSELDALNTFLGTNYKTTDEVHEYCGNSDSFIEVMQL